MRVSNPELNLIEQRLPGVYRDGENRRRFCGRGLMLEKLAGFWEARLREHGLVVAAANLEALLDLDVREDSRGSR
jgi:hypothetical protein